MDNIAIIFILLINKKIIIINEYQFQFPFTSEVISIVTKNTITISKRNKDLFNLHELARFIPQQKLEKGKNTHNTLQYLSK